MEIEELELRKAFYAKKSNLRAEVLKQDWTKDANLVLPGGRGYAYLSSDKIKKNIAPLFPKFGLEFRADDESVTQMEGVGNMTQHWIVKCNFTLIDVDTGFSDTSSSYGEAADSGDKGVSKAKSNAFKRWAIAEFQLADGIDPDSLDVSMVSSRNRPMTDEEEAVIKSKMAEKAVARSKEKAEEKPAEKPAEAPAEKPAEKSDKPMTKAEEALAKLKAQKEGAEAEFVPMGPQKRGIEKILNAAKAKKEGGTMDDETYGKIMAEHDGINSAQKATEFIVRYQSVV